VRVVYFIRSADGSRIKIGTTGRLAHRLRQLEIEYGHGLVVIGVMEGFREDEAKLHRRFSHHRVEGEWFLASEELQTFITENAEPWEPVKLVGIKVDKWVIERAKLVAKNKGVDLFQYIHGILDPIVLKDTIKLGRRSIRMYDERKRSKRK
jgi:hypothetical protein